MSGRGDYGDEMPPHDPSHDGPLDDRDIHALLADSAEADAELSAFVSDVRAAAGAVPTPSPALAAAIAAGGISDQPPKASWSTMSLKVKGFIAGLGVAGKVAL